MTFQVPTAAGRMVPLASTLPGDVSIRAVAAQLSALALWHGATTVPYHPAQRAVLMSETFAGSREALHALLWPAPLAFLGIIEPAVRADLTAGPWGEAIEAALRRREAIIRHAVALAAGLGDIGDLFAAELAHVERVVIATELRDLNLPPGLAGTIGPLPGPLRQRIQPWPWEKAEHRFLRRWRLLAEIEGLDPWRSEHHPDRPAPAACRPGFNEEHPIP